MAINDAMRLLWINGLTDCAGARSWNTDKFFQSKYMTVQSSLPDEVWLYVGNPRNSVDYFAHEADRFASASFESLRTASKNAAFPRSTGWLLIKGYYSAFFAVHALMRLHGWACTRLTSANLKDINKELLIHSGGNQKINAGLFLLKSLSGGREIHCQRIDSSLGGTHEMLWSLLPDFFSEITNVVLSVSAVDSAYLVQSIEDFRRSMDKVGGAKWLSSMRNKLNYAHEFGAWFPYHKSTSDFDRINTILATWDQPLDNRPMNKVGDDVVRFADACAYLVAACSGTVRDLVYRSKTNSPFRMSCGRLV